jgi:hypothetical protein
LISYACICRVCCCVALMVQLVIFQVLHSCIWWMHRCARCCSQGGLNKKSGKWWVECDLLVLGASISNVHCVNRLLFGRCPYRGLERKLALMSHVGMQSFSHRYFLLWECSLWSAWVICGMMQLGWIHIVCMLCIYGVDMHFLPFCRLLHEAYDHKCSICLRGWGVLIGNVLTQEFPSLWICPSLPRLTCQQCFATWRDAGTLNQREDGSWPQDVSLGWIIADRLCGIKWWNADCMMNGNSRQIFLASSTWTVAWSALENNPKGLT